MPLLKAIAETKQRYGAAADFLRTFSKDIQMQTALHPHRAYLGKAPSLAMVRTAYSHNVLIAWVMAQLEDVNDFSGTAQKMSIAQMEQLAKVISTEYYYLKVTEFHLFLHRLKAGKYGVFYGVIDPLKISASLFEFTKERRTEIMALENERTRTEQQCKRAEWAQNAVSRQEYEQMKQKKDAA